MTNDNWIENQLSASFDRAQAAYDNDIPPYLDDEGEPVDCDRCGNQAVCPECVGA
jgi:hypothetical protein